MSNYTPSLSSFWSRAEWWVGQRWGERYVGLVVRAKAVARYAIRFLPYGQAVSTVRANGGEGKIGGFSVRGKAGSNARATESRQRGIWRQGFGETDSGTQPFGQRRKDKREEAQTRQPPSRGKAGAKA